MQAQLYPQILHLHTTYVHRPCVAPPPTAWHHARVQSHPSCAHHISMHQRPRRATIQPSASQDNKQPDTKPPPAAQQQQPDLRRAQKTESPTPLWAQQLQQRWEGLDTAQKAYTVAVGLLVLAALPKVLTLLVLGLERILIGGLLAVEEVLLEVLFRSGAVVSGGGCMPVIAQLLQSLEGVC